MRLGKLGIYSLLASLLMTGAFVSEALGQTTARYRHTTTLLPDGNILVAGGTNNSDVPTTSAEIYRSTASIYVAAANMPVARASHTATLLPDGRVLVAGGCSGVPCSGSILNTAHTYDPRTNAWTATANNLTTARYNHTATLMPDGKVLIVGGATGAATVTSSCDLYDPATNSFSAAASLGLARAAHTATLLHTGRVFIAGGYLAAAGFAVSTELYDPGLNSWAAGPSLIQQRAFHTATQMGHQKVLIVGGANGRDIEANLGLMQTVEIYDPTSNSITPAAPMNARRAFHTATLKPGGEVSIYGGLSNITTTFLNNQLTFENGSVLSLTRIVGNDRVALLNPVGSTLTLDMAGVPLSVPVNGRLISAEVFVSSPNSSIDVANIFWPWPSGNPSNLVGLTSGDLTGRIVDSNLGGLQETVQINRFQGTTPGLAIFAPQEVTANDNPIPNIRLNSVSGIGIDGGGGSVPPSGAAPLTAGTMILDNLILPMPESSIPGSTNFTGKLTITGGSIDATTDPSRPFSVELSSGSTGVGAVSGTVGTDSGGGPILTLSGLTFSGLKGSISNSTDAAISEAQVEAVLESNPLKEVSGLTFRAEFTLSPVNMTNASFNFDVATIVVRSMQSADFESYNPNTNQWTFGDAINDRIGASSLLAPNQDEAIFGGIHCTDETTCGLPPSGNWTTLGGRAGLIPHPEGDPTWSTGKDLAHARSNHSATELSDGRLLVAGGNNGTDVVAVSEVFDPIADEWSNTNPMRLPRSHHSATLLPNATVLVAGGFTTAVSTGATKQAEIFYPDSRTWVETAPMSSSRSFHSAIVLPDGNVLVAGGFADGTYLDTAEIYFSTMHAWVPIAPMDTERAQHTVSLLQDGRVLVSGGVNVGGVLGTGTAASASPGVVGSEIYDPTTGAWSRVTVGMVSARHSHTATVLNDGRVLMAGGNDGFGEIRVAEIYNPTVNTWTQTTGLGNDMLVARLGHVATLLPTNKVRISGGFTALGGAIRESESFDVFFSSWGYDGPMAVARGDHTVSLLGNGMMVAVGGSDGTQATERVEILPFGDSPDSQTPTTGFRRRPDITGINHPNFEAGGQITITGENFRGRTEAGGGAGGTGNSSFHHPRLILQRIGGSGISSSNDSGFLLDLSSGLFHNQLVSWTNLDSSMTFALPDTALKLPRGWYSLRVGANGQYSDSKFVQIAPDKPTLTPGTPSGSSVGSSSVSWTWTGVSGTVGVDFDGYNIYSATSGVFVATVAHSGGPGSPQVFLHRNLGPDTSDMIKVSAYNIAGDGPVSIATVPVLTPDSEIANLTGTPQSPTEIFWSWAKVGQASSYEIRHASNSALLGTSTIPSFTQTKLSTNTAYGVRIRAVLPGGTGQLSPGTTVFTQAAAPVIGTPPVTNVSTGGFTVLWRENQNPPETQYVLRYLTQFTETLTTLSPGNQLDSSISGLTPNTAFTLEVQALNGDGAGTGFTALGTTVTLAAAPGSPIVTINEPSRITLTWDANGNHALTEYQVLFSSDNFAAHFATFSTFGGDFFLTTATISNLITGQNYHFRVSAYDQFGRETAQTSTQSVTNNGGGPPGSIAFPVPIQGITTAGGTLGATGAEGILRQVSFRIPPHAFPQDTQFFVTTDSVKNCGGIDASITITPIPSLQPDFPFEMSLQYVPGEANLGSVSTLGIVRWDPASSSCVPLPSVVDQAGKTVTAQINHLSTFQLAQLAPQANTANSRIFPNPLYKTRNGFFTFDRMPANTRIRIYTLHGGEVHETTTNASGVATWDATNKAGRPVASGLYIAVIESGGTKKKSKLVVIR